jgi:hypothetical protein
MEKDALFLLKPDFQDAGDDTRYFCPACAFIEGVLGFYPRLRQSIQVTYVDYPRPRPAIVALLGEAHQGCPVLVLADGSETGELEGVREHGGRRFITGEVAITRYLAARYGIGKPH